VNDGHKGLSSTSLHSRHLLRSSLRGCDLLLNILPCIINAGGKRQLQPSHRTTAWMLWPFALWGIILIALYMAAYETIANISSPLATLNIVNFVAIRFTRTIFFAQVSDCLA
jgi:hypothetical protein